MRFRKFGIGTVVSTATIAAALLAGPNAYASHGGGGGGDGSGSGSNRPCGPTHSTAGTGSQGTGWTLKSKYDNDGVTPGVVVVGEEFQINTQIAGQTWHVQLADNGKVFLDKDFVSTTAGITAMSNTLDQGGIDQVMTATATNLGNGETIGPVNGATLTIPGPPPPACGVVAG